MVSFRIFRRPLFPKPVSWQGLFCHFFQQRGSRSWDLKIVTYVYYTYVLPIIPWNDAKLLLRCKLSSFLAIFFHLVALSKDLCHILALSYKYNSTQIAFTYYAIFAHELPTSNELNFAYFLCIWKTKLARWIVMYFNTRTEIQIWNWLQYSLFFRSNDFKEDDAIWKNGEDGGAGGGGPPPQGGPAMGPTGGYVAK